jgi:hypothetical protein
MGNDLKIESNVEDERNINSIENVLIWMIDN